MAARLSASGVARALQCPPAFALPAVDGDSDDARRGRVLHAFLQALADGAPADEALQAIEDAALRAWAARIDRTKIPPRGETEVAMAYDVATGTARRLVVTGHRHYDTTATEIPGTSDLIQLPGVADVEVPTVYDWKTVAFDHDAETARPQLELYALMLARITGAPVVECRVRVVTEDGAVADGGTWRLDWEDLATFGARVRTAWDRVAAARAARAAHERTARTPWVPDVREGPACRYCPAWSHCPAKRAAVATVLGLDPATLTPEEAGRAHLIARDAREAADRLREVVRHLVTVHGPLPTGDGRLVRPDSRGALCVVPAT